MAKELPFSTPAPSPLYEWRLVDKADLRGDLVKIAFKQALANHANLDATKQHACTASNIANDVIEFVDAQLAVMETTPDTGPHERTSAVIRRVKHEIQAELTQERLGFSQNPALDETTSHYRHEFERGMLRAIDIAGAMEKTGAEENDNAE